MTQVLIVGGGVVGAAIAYELSLVPGLEVILCDRDRLGQGSTGAALGVLMGAISQKKSQKSGLETPRTEFATLFDFNS